MSDINNVKIPRLENKFNFDKWVMKINEVIDACNLHFGEDGSLITRKTIKAVNDNEINIKLRGAIVGTLTSIKDFSEIEINTAFNNNSGIISNGALADKTITSAKIANYTIEAINIATETITNIKMAENSIDTKQLINDSVSTSKIANGAITVDKMASNSVAETNIKDDAVTESKIKNNSVTKYKLNINKLSDVSDAVGNINLEKLNTIKLQSGFDTNSKFHLEKFNSNKTLIQMTGKIKNNIDGLYLNEETDDAWLNMGSFHVDKDGNTSIDNGTIDCGSF